MVTSLRATVKNTVLEWIPGVLRRGPVASKRIALTFDDGPDELTSRYLDVLDDLSVPATFFVCGERAARNRERVREYLRRGHQIANHGYDHTSFSELPRRALLDQVTRTDEAIGGQPTGRPWVRPPHGELDTPSLLALRSAGYIVALWSVDSGDHAERNIARIAERCRPGVVGSGDVILLHEGQPWTLAALPRIVAALHGAGLECVTMYDLFAR